MKKTTKDTYKMKFNLKNTILSAAACLSLVSTALSATSYTDKDITDTVSALITKNSKGALTVQSITVKEKMAIAGAKGFTGYIIRVQAQLEDPKTKQKSQRNFTDGFFVSSEGLIATQLISLDGKNLVDSIVPTFDTSLYYTKEHLIQGDGNAKDKLMVFSDPLCYYCRESYKELLDKSKGKYDVYLIDFPIERIHPASPYIVGVAKQIKRLTGKDVMGSIYMDKKYEELLKIKNKSKIISFLESSLNIKVNKEELEKVDMLAVSKDKKLGADINVQGTPSFYINGTKTTIDNI